MKYTMESERMVGRFGWVTRGLRASLGLLLLGMPLLAQAEIYKWVDENGLTQYSERPPETAGKEAEVINIDRRTPDAVPSALPQNKVERPSCGRVSLPADLPDPVANILQFRQVMGIWQAFLDENIDKKDANSLQNIKDIRCAIDYGNRKLQELSEAEQQLNSNYESASEELDELQQRVAECDQQEGESEGTSAAQCKQQYTQRITELKEILRNLEGSKKALGQAQ